MRPLQRPFMSACVLDFRKKSAGVKRSLDPTETIFLSRCNDMTSEHSDLVDSSD